MDLIRDVVPLEDRAILDVGCGVGMYVRAFRRFSQDVHGVDVDEEKVAEASRELPNIRVASAEQLPYPSGTFDVVLLHEVIEHLNDDRRAVAEAVRVLRGPGPGDDEPPGRGPGRLVVFAPNRMYPFETHGVFWRGRYRFGNIPLVNYLPDRWRRRLCPHVRAYTRRDMRQLMAGHSVRIVVLTQIYPGYDKIVRRYPVLGHLVRKGTYLLERTPLTAFGLSHLLIAERAS